MMAAEWLDSPKRTLVSLGVRQLLCLVIGLSELNHRDIYSGLNKIKIKILSAAMIPDKPV